MVRLFHGNADFFGPRMACERGAEQLLEFGPMPIGGDREVQSNDPATLIEEN